MGSIQLARIFGIRFGVDPSWFLVLFLLIYLLSAPFQARVGGETAGFLTAVAAVLCFFASVGVHELGHALAARREGIGITGIDLFFFGGVARMARDTSTPGQEFRVAAAGPAMTVVVVVVVVLLGLAIGGEEDFRRAGLLEPGTGVSVSPVLAVLNWLALVNVTLFVFNLVPAFPLDGGRIARAAAWKLTGRRGRATRISAYLGQAFGWLLIGLGGYLMLSGAAFDGVYLAVLGFLLGSAARQAVTQSAVSDRLEGVTVADVMDDKPVVVPASLGVKRALDEFFLRWRADWFPVVEDDGRLVGTVRIAALQAAPYDAVVRDVAEDGAGDERIWEEEPIEHVLGSEALRRAGRLLAVDREGILRGVVTLEQVSRAVHARLG